MKKIPFIYLRLFIILLKDQPLVFLGYWMLVTVQALLPATGILLMARLFEEGSRYISGVSEFTPFIYVAVWFAGIQLVENILTQITFILFSSLQRHLKNSLDLRVFEKIQRLRLEKFEQSVFYDQFARARSVISSGRFINFMRRAVAGGQSMITAIAMTGVIVKFSPWLAFSLFLTALPAFILRLVRGKQFWQLQWFQSPNIRMLDYFTRLLTGRNEAKEIRVFEVSEFFLNRIKVLRGKLREERWLFERKNIKYELLYSIATTEVFAYSCGIIIAVSATFSGRLGLSELAATLIALRNFQSTVRASLIHFTYVA
ncbi:hypothetical protein [Paenibacillus sp. GYB003]|uniref:hypothetical protein n=1 Tax=Paenibacillus sp. GYB003 TaxID=2994392 RepID=UPI002F960F6A